MRDRLAHRYVDTLHAIVQSTAERDLPLLEQAVLRLLAALEPGDPLSSPAR